MNGSPIFVGEHATVELLTEGGDFLVTVNVPFELRAIADVQLDISPTVLRLVGPAPDSHEILIQMPDGFRLDPETSSARYSPKRRQLTVTTRHSERIAQLSPSAKIVDVARHRLTHKDSLAPSRGEPLTGEPTAPAWAMTSPCLPSPAASDRFCGASQSSEEDDDDLPPPLDAARCRNVQDIIRDPALGHAVNLEENTAATQLMETASAALRQKRKETEESRKNADLSAGGIKKGFLTQTRTKKNQRPKSGDLDPNTETVACGDVSLEGVGKCGRRWSPSDSQEQPRAPEREQVEVEAVPYVDVRNDSASTANLQLPEVQEAMWGATEKLKKDHSWMTPQLLQAFSSRPDLMRGLSDQRIQDALALMQSDPAEAQRKYSQDTDVSSFLKEFSSLMATHFDVISQSAALGPSSLARHEVPSPSSPVFFDDPKVQDVLQDTEVQQLLASLQSGRSLEIHDLARANPRLFCKVKVLLDNGLLNMGQ